MLSLTPAGGSIRFPLAGMLSAYLFPTGAGGWEKLRAPPPYSYPTVLHSLEAQGSSNLETKWIRIFVEPVVIHHNTLFTTTTVHKYAVVLDKCIGQ